MQFLSHRQHIDRVDYTLFFPHIVNGKPDHNWGFGFPCDESGRVDESTLNPVALANYRDCAAGLNVAPGYVQRWEWIEHIPAVIRCDCGRHVHLSDGWANGCDCGREYNMGGTLLAPRSQWGEETGETFTARNWSNDV